MSYDNVDFDSSYSAAPKEIHPKGIFKAVTVDIVDLPQQKNNFYDPNKKGSKPFIDQVKLVWENGGEAFRRQAVQDLQDVLQEPL